LGNDQIRGHIINHLRDPKVTTPGKCLGVESFGHKFFGQIS